MEKIVLENGLTILFFEDEKKHSTLVNFVTRFGAINHFYIEKGKKRPIPSGMAHLLEHLLIERSPYGNIMHAFGEMQMNTNGSTYINRTEYYFNAVEKTLEALPILLKAINGSSFTEKDTKKVKGAIYEEIRRNEDDKIRRLYQKENECLFVKFPYRNGLGSLTDVESITYEQIKACYDFFYRWDNQYLIVAGNFERDKIIQEVEKICAELPRKPKVERLPQIKEPCKVHKKRGTVYMPTARPIIELSFKLDLSTYSPSQKLALDFYMHYFLRMNFGSVSLLSQTLQTEKVIVGGIRFSTHIIDTYMVVSIGSITEEEKIFERKILETLKKPVFSEELFSLYQKNDKIDIALREESIGDTVFPFMENLFTFDYPYKDTVEQISAYSFTDFESYIKKLDFSNYCLCKVIEPINR